MAEDENDFEEWSRSDNVILYKGIYRTQCTLWKKPFTKSELETYFNKEYK